MPAQVLAEPRRAALLRRGPVAKTVRERRPERIVGGARQVGSLVDDDAGDGLAHPGAHDPRLARVEGEAFVAGDGGDEVEEARDRGRQPLSAGEGQIVGVARVGGIDRGRQRRQARVEREARQVGERRRGRRALRQVRLGQPAAEVKQRVDLGGAGRTGSRAQDGRGDTVRRQRDQRPGHALGIARGAKQPVDARRRHVGEEGAEIGPDDDRLTRVQGRVRQRRTTGAETVRRLVGRDRRQDAIEDAALHGAQASLGSLEEAHATAALADPGVAVAQEARAARRALDALAVGHPGQHLGRDAEPGRQLTERRQGGHRPGRRRHRQRRQVPGSHDRIEPALRPHLAKRRMLVDEAGQGVDGVERRRGEGGAQVLDELAQPQTAGAERIGRAVGHRGAVPLAGEDGQRDAVGDPPARVMPAHLGPGLKEVRRRAHPTCPVLPGPSCAPAQGPPWRTVTWIQRRPAG